MFTFRFFDRVLTLSPRPSLPVAFASLCPYHLRSQPSTWTGWGDCKDADQVEMVKCLVTLHSTLDKASEDARKVVELAKPDLSKLERAHLAVSNHESRALQNHCEEILEMWCEKIEQLLKENISLRSLSEGNVTGGSQSVDVLGPLEEIDWWRNRLMRLQV